MVYNEFECIAHAVAQATQHLSMPGTPAMAQIGIGRALTDVEAETDLGAVAELGYN